MKIFLDTADLSEIKRAADAGLIDGITTNPSLLSKAAGEEGDPREILREICETVPGPISAEVVATDADTMVREGRKLAKIADNIVVKS
ncbi:MAG: fructose-6-phosphate aldolase, partial [Gemmatimonadetes bacterium]|nr:fructose-6-phosphate aldolase [Gemmatimonadota bacterium]NIQ54874.1 fructose-6-phosphate aldolase [Gemmatimonadota bacterium]NIU75072.1 fructose-6-phosphate aldolase [Gammaproteobacteria bacterium]NIX45131.1 fructose-6-phosphate aldolase [Gemmatimonadota bacterium]NIY09382.1 fructose-6-phosphate aldolase [Gemmatimonadota bacterium]